jgi:hypothetical protein
MGSGASASTAGLCQQIYSNSALWTEVDQAFSQNDGKLTLRRAQELLASAHIDDSALISVFTETERMMAAACTITRGDFMKGMTTHMPNAGAPGTSTTHHELEILQRQLRSGTITSDQYQRQAAGLLGDSTPNSRDRRGSSAPPEVNEIDQAIQRSLQDAFSRNDSSSNGGGSSSGGESFRQQKPLHSNSNSSSGGGGGGRGIPSSSNGSNGSNPGRNPVNRRADGTIIMDMDPMAAFAEATDNGGRGARARTQEEISMLHNAAEQGWGVTPAAQREALGLEARAMLAQREAVYQARMQDFEQQEADRAAGLGQGMAKYQQDREEYQRRLAAWQQNQEEWRQYQQQLTEWRASQSNTTAVEQQQHQQEHHHHHHQAEQRYVEQARRAEQERESQYEAELQEALRLSSSSSAPSTAAPSSSAPSSSSSSLSAYEDELAQAIRHSQQSVQQQATGTAGSSITSSLSASVDPLEYAMQLSLAESQSKAQQEQQSYSHHHQQHQHQQPRPEITSAINNFNQRLSALNAGNSSSGTSHRAAAKQPTRTGVGASPSPSKEDKRASGGGTAVACGMQRMGQGARVALAS